MFVQNEYNTITINYSYNVLVHMGSATLKNLGVQVNCNYKVAVTEMYVY